MKRPRFWLATREHLKQKCLEFILLEGYFNPVTFSELEYALHNQEYVHTSLIRELCRLIRCPNICEKCQATCMYRELCKKVEHLHIERSPPCIQKAYSLGRFHVVQFYFSLLGFFSYGRKEHLTLKCNELKKQKLCEPDDFCKEIASGNLIEYYRIRLIKKLLPKQSDNT
ncbi:MAG: hypothetical protein QXO71_02730 [Candidatus Jordarchaeaceae archaeon]